ncbi:GAF domain-containing protein [Pseudoclavibacter sp. CFCC 11306]|uniref:GAF domain-containing protein n=1 Tax=Pseudoclavibacter sp. CFCC 11306 TaxID=1564493 RepID=UPI001300CE47|nr:GAF domain-containing protein [Pseudoclavibacter sp. CFCC 11306]KAB1659028.1 GAF domain-containing protein [Pseudoclavibacter sp. CFCC 11306]
MTNGTQAMRDRVKRWVDAWFPRIWWLPDVVASVLGIVSTLLLTLFGADTTNMLLLVFGVVCAVVGLVVKILQMGNYRQAEITAKEKADQELSNAIKAKDAEIEKATQEAVSLQAALKAAFLPVVHDLRYLAACKSNKREAKLVQLVGTALGMAPMLITSAEKYRMVVYRRESGSGLKTKLVVMNYFAPPGNGRDEEPRPFISGDGGRGDKVLAWLAKAHKPKFIGNVADETDPDWQGSGNGYATYISAPLKHEDRVYGMLTVDSAEPGDLDPTDERVMRLLAGLITVGFQIRNGTEK